MEAAGKGGKAPQERKAKRKRSTGHNPEECPVCMTVYDGTVQRPHILPCGHTVCTICVHILKQQGRVACPECRVSHAVPEGEQFPVSYTDEARIRRMRGAEGAAAAASPPPSVGTGEGVAAAAGQKEAAGLSRKMRSILQKQEAPAEAAITACQEVQAQLDQYQTTLRGWVEHQQEQLEDRLQGLLDQSSRKVRELVRQEESRAASTQKEGGQWERQLRAALEALRTPATEQEARVALGEVLRCTVEAQEMLEECRGSFPDANTATTVRKVREASDAALEAFQAALEPFQTDQAAPEAPPSGAEEPRPQLEAEWSIVDRLPAILTPSLKGPLQAEDLRSPTQPVRRLLEAGRVFGVHQVEGQHRHARISLKDGKQYLHTLKEEPLPPFATTIPVSQVVPPSPPCTVFLDLSWPGSAPRRVHVRLSPDTPRGRQMVLLCTGQRGPSYAGTRLFGVGRKGQPGECVRGGDYESNDGKGGAALLPDLDKGEYRKSGKAGAVRWWRGAPSRGAQFAIFTRDLRGVFERRGVFGKVVQGLDAVVAAAQHTSIEDVTIMDCGVVLWE